MRRLLVLLLVVAVALGLMLPVAAQEATSTPQAGDGGPATALVNCDSTVILLAGLAQRYFGYTAEPGDLDMNAFEYGQYGPLFDLSTMEVTEDTGEDMTETPTEVAGDRGITDSPVTTSGIILDPPLLENEDLTCIQLRSSLEAYFFNEFQTPDWDQRFRSGMNSRDMTDTGTSGG